MARLMMDLRQLRQGTLAQDPLLQAKLRHCCAGGKAASENQACGSQQSAAKMQYHLCMALASSSENGYARGVMHDLMNSIHPASTARSRLLGGLHVTWRGTI